MVIPPLWGRVYGELTLPFGGTHWWYLCGGCSFGSGPPSGSFGLVIPPCAGDLCELTRPTRVRLFGETSRRYLGGWGSGRLSSVCGRVFTVN